MGVSEINLPAKTPRGLKALYLRWFHSQEPEPAEKAPSGGFREEDVEERVGRCMFVGE